MKILEKGDFCAKFFIEKYINWNANNANNANKIEMQIK